MIRTTLERLLTPERERRQADLSSQAGFAVPGLKERPLDFDQEPLLVTNMRAQFVPTRISRERKVARYGFSECLLEDEPALFRILLKTLWNLSEEKGWTNRCTTLAEATARMRSQGMAPTTAVISYDFIEEKTREELDNLMAEQGYVAEFEGVKVLAADIPKGAGLLTASPSLAGFYTRIDDRLGVLLTRIDTAFQVVNAVA